MNESKINLCVPVIYNENYIKGLVSLNEKYSTQNCQIYEVFGSLKQDVVGNLRPPVAINDINEEKLEKIISYLKDNGIEFNYVMNSTIFPYPSEQDNIEEIISFIKRLVSIGIKRLTVTSVYLICIIKNLFPQLSIDVSICNEISTIHQIKEFDELGADLIVLDRDANRNFKLLKNIKKITKKKIKVLCNSPCVYNCVNVQYHANYTSVLSNSNINDGLKTKMPFCSFYCKNRKFNDLTEHIKTPWIRPEDISIYNGFGIDYFKIDGRDGNPEYILEVVEAYLKQKYDGNFFHLIKRHYPNDIEQIEISDPVKLNVGIDNRMLDKFVENMIINDISCNGDCEACGYCGNYAQNIVYNEEWLISYRKKLAKAIDVYSYK